MISFPATTPMTAHSAPIELRLVEQNPESSIIEVEGICFETIVPTKTLLIPPQSNPQVPVQVKLRVTNRSSQPYRFSSHVSSLLIDVMGKQGPLPRLIKGGSGHGPENPIETDFHLLTPGENIALSATAFLVWQAEGSLALMKPGSPGDSGCGSWLINGLESGTYQIRVTYRSVQEESLLLASCIYENLWSGMVHTPFVAVEFAHA